MSSAMVALATTTLGSAASSVTFGSIPATYRDLRVVINGSLSADTGVGIRFNGDTGSNFYEVSVNARASGGIDSGSGSGSTLFGDYYNAGVLFVKTFDVLDYAQTDKHKSALCRTNAPGVSGGPTTGVQMIAGRWASTAAITSIQIIAGTGNLASGMTLSLFGIVS